MRYFSCFSIPAPRSPSRQNCDGANCAGGERGVGEAGFEPNLPLNIGRLGKQVGQGQAGAVGCAKIWFAQAGDGDGLPIVLDVKCKLLVVGEGQRPIPVKNNRIL